MTDVQSIDWHAHARVDKYTLDQIDACRRALGLDREPIGAELAAFCTADSYVEADGNLLTNIGLKRINNLLLGTATWVALTGNGTTGNGRIGTGNSATAATTADTDLGAASGAGNRQFVKFDSTPGVSNGVVTYVATFTTGIGNYAWAEWGIDGGTANGTTVTSDAVGTPGLINHKITSLGTKTSAASWVFTVTSTLS